MRADWSKLCSAVPATIVSAHHRQGMLLLEHYQPHFWETESPTGESIAKLWNDADLRAKALERTQKHYKVIYKSEIRRNIAFFSKAPLPTMYRPMLTKSVVLHTGAKKVLDPCIGWGGRMLGTLAVDGTTFEGCDPSTKTHSGLQQIAAFCKIADRATLHCAGAEVVLPTLPSGSYDLVLTSPPYFTLEVYTHEETQSVKKHSDWDAWVAGWLDPVIRECLRCLKADGVSAWSVKNMRKQKLLDEVVRIHTKYGFTHTETMGMSSTQRNTGGKAKLTEETLLFRRAA
jgi:tRNA1(Val) A37 N6-methylase TrmN6